MSRTTSTRRKSTRTKPMLSVEHNGKLVPLTTLARRCRINYYVLYSRIVRHKWSVEAAVKTPLFVSRKSDQTHVCDRG